jgi:hypothetical protein
LWLLYYLQVSEDDFAVLEKELRRLMVRVEAAKERLHSLGALRWWLVQHLRGNYRRKKIIAGILFSFSVFIFGLGINGNSSSEV